MEYIQEVQKMPESVRTVITLGKFNGVHRGHQKLIRRVLETGREKGLRTVVIAFSVTDKMLLTKKERYAMLKKMGLDTFVECPLDKKMMRTSPEEFVKELLVNRLHAAHIVIGPDYRFGYQRKGNSELLRKMGETLGFTVEILEKEREGPREISSTYIREQLNEGNMEKVNQLLGYTFSTTGEVLHGRGLGHTIGIPTTNLIPPKDKLMPPNGVYITRSFFSGRNYNGITNVGYKPTVGGESFLGVETYLFDCNEDLYGERSKVEFYQFCRPEQKFPSLNDLKAQLDKDVEKGRQFFGKKSIDKH